MSNARLKSKINVSTCRSALIQNALDRAGSDAHQKIFFVTFGPFENFLSTFEQKKLMTICVNLQTMSEYFSSFGV